MDNVNEKAPARRGSKCAFIHCKNKRKCSLRLFFPFPDPGTALRKAWLANMRMEGYVPTLYDSLCADHFDPTCFTRRANLEPLVTLREDAVPTLFEFPKKPTAYVTVTPHEFDTGPCSPATAATATNKNLPIKTTIMESRLSRPITMTLPPSSRLVIVPVRKRDGRPGQMTLVQPNIVVKHAPPTRLYSGPMYVPGTTRKLGQQEEDDVDLQPRDMAGVSAEQEEVMKGILERRVRLSQARTKLRKLRCSMKAGRKRLRQLHDLMFSERTVVRDGARIVEITLSNWAKEVFSDAAPGMDIPET